MDIEVICAEDGIHKTVEEALKHTLGELIDCEHIGCAEM